MNLIFKYLYYFDIKYGIRHSFDRLIRMYFKWKIHWKWVNGIKNG